MRFLTLTFDPLSSECVDGWLNRKNYEEIKYSTYVCGISCYLIVQIINFNMINARYKLFYVIGFKEKN